MEDIDPSCLQESRNSQIIYSMSSPRTHLVQESQIEIARQLSAPFYLFSLKDNEAPPFKKPDVAPRPCLVIGSIMNEKEAVQMIEHIYRQGDHTKQYLDVMAHTVLVGDFVVKKQITHNFNLKEKNFLVSLLTELIDYSAQRDFSAHKLACMITLYLNTHKYFKIYYWLPPTALWKYFKELMIMHSIEDSPDGQEVFEPDECYDILSHFHTIYLSNLPLIHTLVFGVYKIKFIWPFN